MIKFVESVAVVPVPRLRQLLLAEATLALLEAGGVDNWEGYTFSLSENGETLSEAEDRIERMIVKGMTIE